MKESTETMNAMFKKLKRVVTKARPYYDAVRDAKKVLIIWIFFNFYWFQKKNIYFLIFLIGPTKGSFTSSNSC